MRTLFCIPLALVALLGLGAPLTGQEPADARAILDKAIKAHGGAELLAKYNAATWKGKGTVRVMGEEIAFTGEGANQGAEQSRVAIIATVNGEKFPIVHVYNRGKGWLKLGNAEAQEMDEEQLAEAKQEHHAEWVASFGPLLKPNKDYTLAVLPETKVGGQAAVGVRVSRKGYRDVQLYFDKQTGLLLKMTTKAKNEESGQIVDAETLYSEYQEVQGVKVAMKLEVRQGGKEFLELEVSAVKLHEKLDDKMFAKP
jgi:hypothetical protein